MVRGFVSLTEVAGLDIFLDEFAELRPVIVTLQEFDGLGLARMSGFPGVVSLLEEFDLDVFEVGDVDEVLVHDVIVMQSKVAELIFESVVPRTIRMSESVKDILDIGIVMIIIFDECRDIGGRRVCCCDSQRSDEGLWFSLGGLTPG